MTVLLSLTVFMNLVSAIMPTTSDAVPLIGNTRQQTKTNQKCNKLKKWNKKAKKHLHKKLSILFSPSASITNLIKKPLLYFLSILSSFLILYCFYFLIINILNPTFCEPTAHFFSLAMEAVLYTVTVDSKLTYLIAISYEWLRITGFLCIFTG